MITIKNEPKRYVGVENRVQIMALVLAIVFTIPCLRLWHLQIVKQRDFQDMADAQRISETTLESGRYFRPG